jgi:CRISPR-associated protein (TIGR02710 family)
MLKKILVVTVGGSCSPIVTSIKENTPDKIYFICSDDDRLSSNKGSYYSVVGEGKVCGNDWKNPDKPNIVTQMNLEKEQFDVIKIKYFDDHNYCYKESINLLRNIQSEFSESEIIADYTGGTKSMTVGLVMAAADLEGITIAVVKGDRTNLIKVDDGTERVKLTRINYAFIEKQKQNVEFLIHDFDYSSATSVLQKIFSMISDLPKHLEDELQYYFTVCKAFEAWDKFNHTNALSLLKPLRKKYYKYILFLENVIESRIYVEKNEKNIKSKISGYEVVEDLVLNSERRAFKKRFDDAVARIYRATELFAQIYLKKEYNQETGNIDISILPKELQDKYEKKRDKSKRIRLGLMDSYELISDLKDEKIGFIFNQNRKKILSSLEVRNASILAHGFIPVNEENYTQVQVALIQNFLVLCLNKVTQKSILELQFPQICL